MGEGSLKHNIACTLLCDFVIIHFWSSFHQLYNEHNNASHISPEKVSKWGVDRMARKVKALAGKLEDLGLIPAQDPCDEVKELTPACTHAHHDTCVSLP